MRAEQRCAMFISARRVWFTTATEPLCGPSTPNWISLNSTGPVFLARILARGCYEENGSRGIPAIGLVGGVYDLRDSGRNGVNHPLAATDDLRVSSLCPEHRLARQFVGDQETFAPSTAGQIVPLGKARIPR